MPLSYREGLTMGLRPRTKIPINSQWFQTFKNLKPTVRGGIPVPQIAQPIPAAELTAHSVTISHPFPQLFRGKGITLLATATEVFVVDESDWTLDTMIQHYGSTANYYDLYTPASDTTITNTSSTPWQFIDFHGTWFLLNGEDMVMHTDWVDADKVFVQGDVTVTCGCNHNGRAFFGGFDPENLWTKWSTIWEGWMEKAVEWGFTLNAPGTNWVWFSSIGGGDLMHFFLPDLAQYGLEDSTFRAEAENYDADHPVAQFFMKRLSSGFLPMDWQGTVWNIKPLGPYMIVYGSDGISAMQSISDPIPTYGLIENIHELGLASRCAIGGDNNQHFFVDAEGVLWAIDAQLKKTRLGYKEVFSTMLGNEIIISYDPVEREVYISDSAVSFLLTEHGLCSIKQLVSSVVRAAATVATTDHWLLGVVKDISGSAADDLELKTEVFDFGNREIKTLKKITVQGANTEDLVIVPYYHFDTADAFVAGTTLSVDTRGQALSATSGIEFYLSFKDTSPVDVEITDIIIEESTGERISLKERLSV